jgi:tetratricopeptide (TPR) repeat protein
VVILAGTRSPTTEVEARALGKGVGARLVLWGNLTALREDLVLDPVLTSTRGWEVFNAHALSRIDGKTPVEAFRWSRASASVMEDRRRDAELLVTPAALRAAEAISDSGAAFAVLDEISVKDVGTEATRGLLLNKTGKFDDSVKMLRTAIAKWPDSFRLRHLLWGSLSSGKHQRAEAEVDAMADLARGPSEWLDVVWAYFMEGNNRRATECAEEALRRFPVNKEVALWVARFYVRTDHHDRARSLVASASREPLSPSETLAAAIALTGLGEVEAALPFNRRLVRSDDSEPSIRVSQANFLKHSSSQEDRELAIMGARRAAKDAPDNPRVQGLAGRILLERGLEDEGLSRLRLASDLSPGDPDHLVALGMALLARDPGTARDTFKRAATLKPGPGAAKALARGWLMLREPELALQALALVPGPNADVAPVPEMRCDALVLLGQWSEARAVAQRLATATPTDEWGMLSAMVCSAKAGEANAGREILRGSLPTLKHPWANRVATFLLGNLSESQLLSAEPGLSRHFSPDGPAHRCEANYYAGIFKLYPINGLAEPEEASKRFRASLEGHAECTEMDLAQIELYRLEHPHP